MNATFFRGNLPQRSQLRGASSDFSAFDKDDIYQLVVLRQLPLARVSFSFPSAFCFAPLASICCGHLLQVLSLPSPQHPCTPRVHRYFPPEPPGRRVNSRQERHFPSNKFMHCSPSPSSALPSYTALPRACRRHFSLPGDTFSDTGDDDKQKFAITLSRLFPGKFCSR